jgi:hypothetical protein
MVGVEASAFPQARVFQAKSATTVYPKKMGKRGRYAMGWLLGMKFGVWMSNARLQKGLKIEPRRFSLGPLVRDRVKQVFSQWILKGRAQVAA